MSGLACSLNVLEVHLRVLAEVDDGPQEVEESLKALEGLEDLGQGLGGQLLVVLGGNLHADLKVLADVGLQHGFDALQGILNRQ